MRKILFVVLLVSFSASATEYIVKLREGKSVNFLSQKSNQVKRHHQLSFGHFAVVDASQQELKSLLQDPAIEYMEPNIELKALNIEDPQFEKQWGLKNTGRNVGGLFGWFGRAGMDINAEQAWNITRGSSDIKIAVIDTGVDYNHPDLQGNIMINDAELNGEEGVDDDGNGYVDDVYGYDFATMDNDPMDGNGHGTHCAGVIGALHDNQGVRGVMANVKILPVQFLTARGSGTLEGAIMSIDYAISRGVDVMSNSWGGGGTSQALYDAVERAYQAGIVFTAASGNSNADNDSTDVLPANIDLPNVISVGAIDGRGKRANFSNYGENKVHVFAPGVNTLSTFPNNQYKSLSGTSMACPHVSGIVGLMLTENPNLTPEQVRQTLIDTTRQIDDLDGKAQGGLVNAFEALN